jgi:hypothetical protein
LALKSLFGGSSPALDVGLSGLDLILSFGTGLADSVTARLDRGLPPRLLGTEHGRPGLTQTLLVFRRASIGGGYIRLRFLDRTLSFASTLCQDALQRLVHDGLVQAVKNGQ